MTETSVTVKEEVIPQKESRAKSVEPEEIPPKSPPILIETGYQPHKINRVKDSPPQIVRNRPQYSNYIQSPPAPLYQHYMQQYIRNEQPHYNGRKRMAFIPIEESDHIMSQRRREMFKQLELQKIVEERYNRATVMQNTPVVLSNTPYHFTHFTHRPEFQRREELTSFPYREHLRRLILDRQNVMHVQNPRLENVASASIVLNQDLIRRKKLYDIEREIEILKSNRNEELLRISSIPNIQPPPNLEASNHDHTITRLTQSEVVALHNADMLRRRRNYITTQELSNYHNRDIPQYPPQIEPQQNHQRIYNNGEEFAKKSRIMCRVCGKPSQFICSGCHLLWYCSPACQAKDWQVHRMKCAKV